MWQIAGQIAIIVLGLVGGAATVPVVRYLKDELHTNGAQTIALAAGVSLVLTLASAVVEGVLAPGTVTGANFGVVFLALFVSGQVRYRQIRDDLEAG